MNVKGDSLGGGHGMEIGGKERILRGDEARSVLYVYI
jgi:hypothetical protein